MKRGGYAEMDTNRLIGMRVMNTNTHAIGVIMYVKDNIIAVDYHGQVSKYAYPSAFASHLELEDEKLQEDIRGESVESSFDRFRTDYKISLNREINYLRVTGGKKQKIVDGERLPSKNGEYLYAFDTDTDLHYPDGTAIKLWFPEDIVTAYIVSCEDFTIIIRTMEYIGENVESVDFTSEQWQLLESLGDRLDEMSLQKDSIAYEIVCNGKKQISPWKGIIRGQNAALNRAASEKISFIWGPQGTGKTETLANIALEHINQGRRVLMLSYSNVSVDGALLRVANKADFPDGKVIRYGYPRTKELIDSETLTSYQYVLHKNPQMAQEYKELLEKKKKMKKRSSERLEINKRLNRIRENLLEQEKAIIHSAVFIATTVSKATVDKALYMQRFDVVIFDEASMAYVPQIVFSAGLAKSFFICMGDFCQLPAIVQCKEEQRLAGDIFEYTGITSAVENDQCHGWLVMLDTQYRMHPDIAYFVSKYMYGDRLKTYEKIIESRNEIASCKPCPDSAMALIDLSGMYSVCTKTKDGSRVNILSALLSLRMAEKGLTQFEVGIITPYSAQSRLILSMVRDIQEYDNRWKKVACATVHQFQGSEKPVIIYDAVDCYRMSYPGTLLTSLHNDNANRLFNVAFTRAKGKFILIANKEYLKIKHISKKLIFTKAIEKLSREKHIIEGGAVLDEFMPSNNEQPIVYVEDRETSWQIYIEDLQLARNSIYIDIPDVIDDNDEAIKELSHVLFEKKEQGVDVRIRLSEDIDLPNELIKYRKNYEYVTNPITIIDKKMIWFGQPLYAADFISEGDIMDTEYFPCVRFVGKYTARSIQAFLEM